MTRRFRCARPSPLCRSDEPPFPVREQEKRMRVLVVEDERKVAEALRDGLEAEQYDVVIERSGIVHDVGQSPVA